MKKLGIRISYNIRRILAEKGMKQYELAEKLRKTPENISVFLCSLERGKASNVKTLEEIANALEVDVSIFFDKIDK